MPLLTSTEIYRAGYENIIGKTFLLAAEDSRLGNAQVTLGAFAGELIHALRLGQLTFFDHDDGGEPSGFLVWAWTSWELLAELSRSPRVMHPTEWREGRCLFVLAAGHIRRLRWEPVKTALNHQLKLAEAIAWRHRRSGRIATCRLLAKQPNIND